MKKIASSLLITAALFGACKEKPKPLPQELVQPVAEKPKAKPEPQMVESEPEPEPIIQDKYFLIAGSFRTLEQAQAYESYLIRNEGYSPQIVQRSYGANSEFYRVAYKSFADKSTAFNELEHEREIEGKEVWLLVKEQ